MAFKFVLPMAHSNREEIHDRPVVSTIIWYRVGSRDEELGQTGKSHFLEHMLFKGTDRYKKGEIDLVTVRNGGSNNAFTWLDFTAYYFKLASDRWQLALEIESNRMRNTAFDQDEFEAEKQVVEEELRIGLDGRGRLLKTNRATAFASTLTRPTVGWLADLESPQQRYEGYYDKCITRQCHSRHQSAISTPLKPSRESALIGSFLPELKSRATA